MRLINAGYAIVAALCVAFASVDAQGLADRVSAVRNGSVTLHFAARPGICGDGSRLMRFGLSSVNVYSDRTDDRSACLIGPAQVRLTLRDGEVERVETWVGPIRDHGGRDLGEVPSAQAARYLLDVVAHARGSASTQAILPAVLAENASVWPALLTIAHDSATRSRTTRTEAVFWLARFADAARSGHPNDLTGDDDGAGDDVKLHALFALSQLPHGEGVEPLLDVARTSKDHHLRSRALFWLGQSGDARALALFESMLRS
ncbi:MAG: hypothetical protein ABJE47_05165 [bacterium]